MPSITQKRKAERDMRELLAREGLPAPDEVQYGDTCIWVLWHESKAAVRIDLRPEPDEEPDSDWPVSADEAPDDGKEVGEAEAELY